jgi:hypothetical protein
MKLPFFMTSALTKLLLLSGSILALASCENEKETLEVETPGAYIIPLQPGKYITYRLDSTVYVEAGRKEEIHSYQEKHVVDAAITDNLGRASYRIFRYLRDTAGTKPWTPAGSFVITPLTNTIEVIQNNMRVLVLSGPIREGQTWKGNRFLSSNPYGSLHGFSNDNNMPNWNFVIESMGQTETFNNQTINDVLTVTHAGTEEDDISENVPVTDSTAFASKTFSLDKYAKGIGLVYQEHILWEYQPDPGDGPTPATLGFGVRRTLLEHN